MNGNTTYRTTTNARIFAVLRVIKHLSCRTSYEERDCGWRRVFCTGGSLLYPREVVRLKPLLATVLNGYAQADGLEAAKLRQVCLFSFENEKHAIGRVETIRLIQRIEGNFSSISQIPLLILLHERVRAKPSS